jgi:LuxR family maltose regulon positive regulatory protein
MVLPLEAFAALIRARNSNRDSAAPWFSNKITASTLEPNPPNEPFLLNVAHLMAALDRPDESVSLIRNVIRFAEAGGRTRTLIQAKVALAGQLADSGNNSEALSHILDALQLAAPEGFVSTFVDEGGAIRQLLNEAKSRVPPELGVYVERILTGFAPAENPPVQRETDHPSDLSVREREILSLIAEGMSNQEIADRLVISITTVKTHTGNIYNKLGVTSRTRALARAEELGLLPHR